MEIAVLCPYCERSLVRDIVIELIDYKPQIHLWALHALDPELAVFTRGGGRLGKFQVINRLLFHADADYYLLVDDDIVLPKGFLPKFIKIVQSIGAEIAQPALTVGSYHYFPITIQVPNVMARLTTFVESGPLVYITKRVLNQIAPFSPKNPMGWGFDIHWSSLARERGLPIAIVDSCAVDHKFRAVGVGYSKMRARRSMRRFLQEKNLKWPEMKNLAIIQDLEIRDE